MKKIGIIVFFFGKYPWYHSLFIDSCRRNKSIDFIFFSDQFSEQRKDLNLIEVPFSIGEFKALATRKLGIDITVSSGMKICDLRPAFGEIFGEYLREYDFWGYSDTDLIFGNISKFLEPSFLEEYDFISVNKHYPSGYFALYRNNPEVNALYRASPDYQIVFTAPSNGLFEECGGYYADVMNGVNILDTDCPTDTIHHLLERHRLRVRSSYREWAAEDGKVSLRDAKLVSGDNELMLFHFTKLKKNFFFRSRKRSLDGSYSIFNYSIQPNTIIGLVRGNLWDVGCNVIMKTSRWLDSLFNHSAYRGNVVGTYRYMQNEIEFYQQDGWTLVIYNGYHLKLHASFLFGQLAFVELAKVYLQVSSENQRVTVIFPDGSNLDFRKQ